jgi:cytochrome c oxidase subunit 4
MQPIDALADSSVATLNGHVPADPHDTSHDAPHVVSAGVLLAVFAALMVLTFLTVAATWVNLGALNLPIAMGIATVKASLVALYFMHLRYDKPFHGVLLLGALVFVTIFISITLMDSMQYQQDIRNLQDATAEGL